MKLTQAAMNSKKLLRIINQAKLRLHHTAPLYMYGHDVPLNHEQVMELDHKNETGSVGVGETYESEERPGETRTHDQDIGRMLPGGTISQDISDITSSYPDLYPGSIELRPHWHIQGNNKQLQTCGVRKPVETRKGSMLIGGRRIILMTLIWICLVTRIGRWHTR